MSDQTYKESKLENPNKWINNSSEAKVRIKWLLISHVIFWIILGIIILIFGDEQLALATNPGFAIDETHWTYKVVKIYSDTFIVVQLGTIVATILVLIIPKCKSYRRPMLETSYTILFAGIFVESLKPLASRPRPFQEGSPIADEINVFGEQTDSGSMPSGHVAYTGAGVLPHAIWMKKVVISIILSIFSAGMMYIRMYLGVHYATDVLVGNIISLGCAILSFFLFQRIYKNGTIKRSQEWLIFVIWLVVFIATQVLLRSF